MQKEGSYDIVFMDTQIIYAHNYLQYYVITACTLANLLRSMSMDVEIRTKHFATFGAE